MKKRILIVEDDLSLKPLWEHILRRQFTDYHLDWSVSCEEAQKMVSSSIIHESPYALIVTDVFLSGAGTGLDLVRFLARAVKSSPIILVSVVEEDALRDKYGDLLSKMQVLTKPISVPLCDRALDKLFGVDIAPSN
ncbi:response regulator [Bdellovibrio sp. HCB290]|uniref:response regulator n=1 Tax=Bdellovibrio sp. HCB290 TaxID=3394356 RepID=UPI0039B620BD